MRDRDIRPSENRPGDSPLPDAHAHWSAPDSLQTDEGMPAALASSRELRTRSSSPVAPPLAGLFSREGPAPRRSLVVWDPGRCWSGFGLTQLAVGAQTHLHRVRLRQEGAREPLAEFLLTWLPEGRDPQHWGIVEVLTTVGDPLGARVALTLLEQADRAVLLAGGPGDKDLVRRIGDLVRADQWDGPALQLVTPADKPSRADRLRRAAWPRGLRVQVIETLAGADAGWSRQLLDTLLADPTGQSQDGASARAGAAGPAGQVAAAGPLPPVAARNPADAQQVALALAARAAGVRACLLLDTTQGRVLARVGESAEAEAARAVRLWQALQDGTTVDDDTELAWSSATRHQVALGLPDSPGQLLLCVAERRWSDPASLRWHLALARNHLT